MSRRAGSQACRPIHAIPCLPGRHTGRTGLAEPDRSSRLYLQEMKALTTEPPRERAVPFTTISGRLIKALYTAADIAALDPARDLGGPGAFPYTRGIHPTGYRGKL